MSKNCFIRMQKQDLSHKKWIFILSAFANICLILLTFLFITQNDSTMYNWQYYDKTDTMWNLIRAERIGSYFDSAIYFFGGLVAVVGGMITGMYGYKHILWQRTQDTFGSLPVSRRTQFLVYYLNGLYAFLLPFTAIMLIVVPVAMGKLSSITNVLTTLEIEQAVQNGREIAFSMMHLLGLAGKSYILILLMFLTTYHLVILAMTLSGNILNTYVMIGVIGILPTIWGYIWKLMCSSYYQTFMRNSMPKEILFGVSPLGNVFLEMTGENNWITNVMLVIWGILLWILALLMYEKRPSEWAEKGLEIKSLRIVSLVLTTAASGICGWQVMQILSHTWAVLNRADWMWSAVGAVIAGVLCFGVENMILSMNPKSVFQGKRWLGLAMTIAAGVIFIFYLDVFGYDTYLPKKEDIASIGLCNNEMYFANADCGDFLEDVEFTDRDAIYDYLQEMVNNVKELKAEKKQNEYGESYNPSWDFYYSDLVKVTLKNGRSYYRNYWFSYEDREVRGEILCNPAYLKDTLLKEISVLKEKAGRLEVRRDSQDDLCVIETRQNGQAAGNKENIIKVLDALWQDATENPGSLWDENSRLLCTIMLDGARDDFSSYYYYGNGCDVREGMTNTISVLKELGFGRMVEPYKPEEIKSITFTIASNIGFEDYTEMLGYMGDLEEALAYELPQDDEMHYEIREKEGVYYGDSHKELIITDPDEIAELTQFFQYVDIHWMYGFNMDTYEMVECEMEDGMKNAFFLRKAVPAKYLRRIIEVVKQQKTNMSSWAVG